MLTTIAPSLVVIDLTPGSRECGHFSRVSEECACCDDVFSSADYFAFPEEAVQGKKVFLAPFPVMAWLQDC